MEAQGHILIRRKAKNGTNGEPGKNGLQGCILRQSEWAKGIEYRNDEALTSGTRYLDIAIVTTGANTFNAYKCLKTHTSSDSIPVTNTTYWQKFNLSPEWNHWTLRLSWLKMLFYGSCRVISF